MCVHMRAILCISLRGRHTDCKAMLRVEGRSNLGVARFQTKGRRDLSRCGAQVAKDPPEQVFTVPTKLNNVPHARDARQRFYEDCAQSVKNAVLDGGKRLEALLEVPETDKQADVYRAGTVLELIRECAFALRGEVQGRIKLCVQGAMTDGTTTFASVPLALNGVRKMIDEMDVAGDEGIHSAGVGPENVEEGDGVHLVVSPQNAQGQNLVEVLRQHCEAADEHGVPVVLINPSLGDVPSPNGVMQVQGRQERMDFINTFALAYWFSLVYNRPQLFPIYGAVRKVWNEPWIVYKRYGKGDGEYYQALASFDNQPGPRELTKVIWGR